MASGDEVTDATAGVGVGISSGKGSTIGVVEMVFPLNFLEGICFFLCFLGGIVFLVSLMDVKSIGAKGDQSWFSCSVIVATVF